jgi:hypothetical protein
MTTINRDIDGAQLAVIDPGSDRPALCGLLDGPLTRDLAQRIGAALLELADHAERVIRI